jgi:hypothetical protein
VPTRTQHSQARRPPATRFLPAAFSRGFRPRYLWRSCPPSSCGACPPQGGRAAPPQSLRRGAPRGCACNVMAQKCPLFVLSAGWRLVLDPAVSFLAPYPLLCSIPHAGHSAVSRRRRRALAVLDRVGLPKHLLRKSMPCPTGSVPLLTYEAIRHCRVCSLGILDGSAPCCIELVVFSQHVCPCRWRAVCALEESPDARDGMVLPQTPSWRTMPLHAVEYPVSASWTAYCRTGPFSMGTRRGHAR